MVNVIFRLSLIVSLWGLIAAGPLAKASSCNDIKAAQPAILDCWLWAESQTLLFRLDQSLNYDAARTACKNVVNGADLAISDTSQMLDTIMRLAALRSTMGGGTDTMGFWLGHDKTKVGPPPVGHVQFRTQGKFNWIGGAIFPRQFDKNEVDDVSWTNKEVCLKMIKDKHFTFGVAACSDSNTPICMVKVK